MTSLNITSIPKRYFILITLCFFTIGFLGVNDLPGALQHAIMSTFNIDEYKFSLLFSVAAWPACFSFLNGILIDRYLGIRAATFIYIVVLVFGSALFLVGSFIGSYSLLLIGRIFYGLGADPLSLCLNSYALHWFSKSNELGMVFALVTSVPWIGSSVVFFMSNRIYKYVEDNFPLMNALGIAVSANLPFSVMITLSALILGMTYREEKTDNSDTSEEKKDNIKPPWKDVLKFPLLYWLIVLLGTVYYLALMTFLMLSQESLSKRYNMTLDESSNLSSTFSLVTCLLSSPLGILVDKIGRNLIFLSMAIVFGMLGHGIMAFSTSYPYLPVIMLSLSYALMASSYMPLISYLVEKHQTNTAFGIAQSGMSGSFAVGSLIVGRIVSSYGYNTEEIFYFSLLISTVPFWIIVWIVNFKEGNKLCLSAKQKAYSASQNNIKTNDATLQSKDVTFPEMTNSSTPPALSTITDIKD